MFSWKNPAFMAVILALLVLVVNVTVAQAHDHRDVGPYAFTVGWSTEPAYEGLKNAVSLRVVNDENETPIEGLNETLKVEVTHVPTNTSNTFDLRGVLGTPGSYVVDMVPTASGVYQFRFSGKVGDTDVNETFVSRGAGGGFDDIEPAAAIQFPVTVASVREIEGAARGSQTAATAAQVAAFDADDKASSARVLAIVGLVLGAAGLAAGGGGLWVASRKK